MVDGAGPAERELMKVQLADDDRARRFQAGDNVGFIGGKAVRKQGASARRQDAGRVDVVF